MKRFLIAFLLILPLVSISQSIIINGSAPGAEGRTIRLSCPADLLTNTDKELAQATIGPDGKFVLNCSIEKITPATLSIGFHTTGLFIEPGMGYQVDLAPIDYNGNPEESPFMQSQDLQLKFREADPEELNYVLEKLNTIYDKFLLKYYNTLLRDRNKAVIDTFRNQVRREFPGSRNPYFDDCLKYKVAGLELLAQAHSQPQLAKEYFMGSPVLYNNVDYMDFFNQFFAKYFWVTSRVLKFKDYNAIFKGPDSYAKMMKTLAEDTILKKPQLRELVMMKGLYELFYQQGYDQPGILLLLKTISEKSTFPDNKVIASDLISLINHLLPGTPAPDFTLTGKDEKKVSLKDLKGKPVLISFWATYCESCLDDMEIMADLYKKYGSRMYFVSIGADKEFLKMKYFIAAKKEFTWIFLHLGDRTDILKAYDVKSFPDYILVDQEGKIFACPADSPSLGLPLQLERLNNP